MVNGSWLWSLGGMPMGKGQELWKTAKTVIPGGNMLLSKRPEQFLPELPAMRLEQDPIHHHKDVLAHTIAVVAKTQPERLVRLAKRIGLDLRQSYARVGKYA